MHTNHDEAPHTPEPTSRPEADGDSENPLVNIAVNILIPVVALSLLSKTGDRPWDIGPVYGMILAVAFPTVYGGWFLLKTRKFNVFSVLGAAGVLLTGTITIFVWNEDGSVEEYAALLFAIKEAAVPILLGLAVLYSHKTSKPLVDIFLLNPDILDTERIKAAAREQGRATAYEEIRWKGTWMLAGSLLLSAGLNFFLALYFLSGKADRESYNAAVGQLTWVGFLAVGIPLMVIIMYGLSYLIKSIREVTGLERDELFRPR